MAKETLDAVKTATDIHNGDYSSLRGKSFLVCGNMKRKKSQHPGDKTVKKPTLSQRLDKLTELMNSRFDSLEKDVNSLKQDVKDINTRLDNIEKRLDYNNLKQLPKQ